MHATKTIPIVFISVSEPVADGLVASVTSRIIWQKLPRYG
jgi:ABC-type uncharacterized transport system substrate-binding protein